MEDKLNVLAGSTAERAKKANTRLADVEVALNRVSNELTNLRLNVEKIGKQLPRYAQKRDLKEIEHMLSLLSPVKEEIEA